MHSIDKQVIQLLFSIDEMLTLYGDGVELSNENWDDMRDSLMAFGLPSENIMFTLIENARTDITSLNELRQYFNRFLDTRIAVAADTSKTGEDYRLGLYGCDREFRNYYEELKKSSVNDIVAAVYGNLRKVQETSPDYYRLITEGSRGWYFENNWLDGVDGANNSLIINRVTTLKNNIERLEWLYETLADSISRRSLNALIKFWLTWDYSEWRNIALYANDVVDTTVYPFYENEVFVDCGSYIGDTVAQYVNTVNRVYKRIYTYDISRASIEVIKKNLESLPNIIVNHKGTGEKNT